MDVSYTHIVVERMK